MNIKRIVIIVLTIINFSFSLYSIKPDEGMWLPLLLKRYNYEEMQKKGLHLTAEELYDINNSSLKDAIVMLDHGSCTGEIVSMEGLVFTNHHCGYDAIQSHSSIKQDLLTNGFWAMKKEDELKNEGMSATFLIRVEDVTEKVLKNVKSNSTEFVRSEEINKIAIKLEQEANEGGKYEASVKSFFDGNEYYLFVYQTFDDLRLVGAPPTSIGKFGGDTDNWMWPRHTGDFSIFRVYTAPDGSPAKYSVNNIPLKPKHSLPISLKGIKENDFAMIWGYPGNTDRYLYSEGVKIVLDQTAPTIISLRDTKLKIMKTDMNSNPAIKIKYASKYAQTANYWKYFIGQSKGLIRLNIYDKKKKLEENFQQWVNTLDTARGKKYQNVLKNMDNAYNDIKSKSIDKRFNYFNEFFQGAEVTLFAFQLQNKGILSISKTKSDDNTALKNSLKEFGDKFYKDYNSETDKKVLAAFLEYYHKNFPAEYQPEIFKFIEKKYKNDFKKYSEYLYKNSIFSEQEKFNSFIDRPNSKKLNKDPLLNFTRIFINSYLDLNAQQNEINKNLKKSKRLFVAGLREMNPEKKYYPNANSTMRMSYGVVKDYFPVDAVRYNFTTTLKGIIEKEDSTNEEFIVPKKLKELYEKKDFGRYGENGNLTTCFLTNNDITGGNSGSPVINGNGELIGLAFDGNWEAMSGDIAYEPDLQRTICVDIRYVLFVIDKYAGAANLINELNIKM